MLVYLSMLMSEVYCCVYATNWHVEHGKKVTEIVAKIWPFIYTIYLGDWNVNFTGTKNDIFLIQKCCITLNTNGKLKEQIDHLVHMTLVCHLMSPVKVIDKYVLSCIITNCSITLYNCIISYIHVCVCFYAPPHPLPVGMFHTLCSIG